jgi:1-phosphatidylinositol-5-phosphate 4-kinase
VFPNTIVIYFQFLTKLHLMDYSLLVGIADENDLANAELAAGRHENSDSEDCDSGER